MNRTTQSTNQASIDSLYDDADFASTSLDDGDSETDSESTSHSKLPQQHRRDQFLSTHAKSATLHTLRGTMTTPNGDRSSATTKTTGRTVVSDDQGHMVDPKSGRLLSTVPAPGRRRHMQSSTHLDTTQLDRFYDEATSTTTSKHTPKTARSATVYDDDDDDLTESSQSISSSSFGDHDEDAEDDRIVKNSRRTNHTTTTKPLLHLNSTTPKPKPPPPRTTFAPSTTPLGVSSNDTVFKVEDTDFEQLLGSELPGSMIVVGPPKQGKTSHLVDLLRRLHLQLDVVYVFTKTVETRRKLSQFMPSACIITELVGTKNDFKKAYGVTAADNAVVQVNGVSIIESRVRQIIKTFETINRDSKQIRGMIAFDDVFVSKEEAKLGLTLMGECFRVSHRVNLYTVAYLHRLRDIYGQAQEMVNRVAFVGEASEIMANGSYSEIRERTKMVPGLKSDEALKKLMYATMRVGTAMVIQSKQGDGGGTSKSTSGGTAPGSDCAVSVSFWSYPRIEDVRPFTVGHPDLYSMLFMHGRASHYVNTDKSGNMRVTQRDSGVQQSRPSIKYASPFADNGNADDDDANGPSGAVGGAKNTTGSSAVASTSSPAGSTPAGTTRGRNLNVTTVAVPGDRRQNIEPHSLHIVDTRKRRY